MKKALFLVTLLCFAPELLRAQLPVVQVYLDSDLTIVNPEHECPPFGTLGTLYVVATGFSTPILDIEYSVDTHANFIFFAEQFPLGFSGVGLTSSGVLVSFGAPINASGKVLVETIVGAWSCDCGSLKPPYITVGPNSLSSKIQATEWPAMKKIEAAGGVNSLCAVLPSEPSTWGRVKSLYR